MSVLFKFFEKFILKNYYLIKEDKLKDREVIY